MNAESKRLLETIESVPFFSTFLKQSKQHLFSEETIVFLQSMIDKLHETHSLWALHKYNIIKKRIDLPQRSSFHYIPNELSRFIESYCIESYQYELQFPSRKILLHICSNRLSSKELESIVQKIFHWYSFIDSYSSCSTEMDIYMYLLPHKKELPSVSSHSLGRSHVNTAFTTGCQTKTSIYIFRKEEWFKVLIHESFHNLGLDFLALPEKELLRIHHQLKELFHIQLEDLRFYETYCEVWATILNTMFFSYYNLSFQHVPYKKLLENIHTCLCYESFFSLCQCVKVLKHNHTKYSIRSFHTYKEDTQVFCYYVLKSILLVFFPDFLSFCAKNKTLKFPKDVSILNRFFDLIVNHYQHPFYLHWISELEKRNVRTSHLRMTFIEMK